MVKILFKEKTKYRTYAHKLSWRYHENLLSHLSGKILDVGCGSSSIYKYIKSCDIIKTDIKVGSNAEIIADAHFLPFKNDSFDGALCVAVLEHVADPSKVLAEIMRVLKNDGNLYLAIPFLQPVHNDPHDFWRWTREGISYVLEERGFEILRFETASGFWTTLDYLFLKSRSSQANFISKFFSLFMRSLIKIFRERLCSDKKPETYSVTHFILCRKELMKEKL